jgi:hypothetical protein
MQDLGYPDVRISAADNWVLASEPLILGAAQMPSPTPALEDATPSNPEVFETMGIRADFGPTDSPIESSFARVTPASVYTSGTGFGWATNSSAGLLGVNRGPVAGTSPLTQDFISTRDATFLVDLTNGIYDVTLILGDAAGAVNQARVYAEGELRGNFSTLTGQFSTNVFRVAVSDGQLNLDFKSDSAAALAGLEVDVMADSWNGGSGTLVPLSGRFYFAIEDLDTGFILRAKNDVAVGGPLCPQGVFLSSNTRYREWVFHANTLYVGVSDFTTPVSGQEVQMPIISLGPYLDRDTDRDGLGNLSEWIIGTSPGLSDTDNDGLTDTAEVQQSLDPLSGRGFATGVIASLPLPGEAKEVVLEGSIVQSAQQTAYLALGSRGLGIVNASQFQTPILIGQLDLAGDATDVAVASSLRVAVVAANSGGLHFVNVADSSQPLRYLTIPGTVSQVEVVNGVAYAVFGTTIRAYELLTGELIETLALGGSAITCLAREGAFLYTMDSSQRLGVIDLGGGSLTARGSLVMPVGARKLFVGNGIAYIAAESGFAGGFATANVSNPDGPVLLSGVDANNVAGRAVVANGSGLGIAVGNPGNTGNSLDVVNLSDPANTGAFLTRFNLSSTPFGVAIGSGIAFVADGTAGLQVVNYRSFDNQGFAPTLDILPPTDLDTNAPGIQVEAGSVIAVGAQVADDVQVRNVELLLDGQVVRNDVSFPWDLSTRAPLLSAGTNTATLQVRATDTGGNIVMSPVITIALLPDLTPPRVKRTQPATGSILGSLSSVSTYFSEPLEVSALTSAILSLRHAGSDSILGTGDDTMVSGAIATYRNDLNAVFFSFSTNLAPGHYQATINPPISDLAGNTLLAPYVWEFWVVGGQDTDHDGIPDDIELALGLDPNNSSSLGDGVLDGDRDVDGDGLATKWEILFGYDPRNPDTDGNTVGDGNEDPDRDGLTNAQEQFFRTNPLLADTDGDGWPDESEANFGGNPIDPRVGPKLHVSAAPPISALVTGPGQLQAASLGTVIASPPLAVLVTGVGPLDAVNLGTVVAQPPVTLLVPGQAPFDAVTLGVVIAQPPLNVLVPGQGPLGSFSLGTVAAQPPVALLVPGLALVDAINLGTVIAQPPLNLLVPGTGQAEAATPGTTLARPPVSIQIAPQ